jgi:AraC-like DNA-binding protein
MIFYIHHIQTQALKPYVQYILMNCCTEKSYQSVIRSYANTNFCLGVIKDGQMMKDEKGFFCQNNKTGIHSYLTGIYTEPYNFKAKGVQDEICIDFTPAGYQLFFPFPAKTYLLQEDVLTEAFGKNAIGYFYCVFENYNFAKRGSLIEQFLLGQIKSNPKYKLSEAILSCHVQGATVHSLSRKLKCSERTLHRLFTQQLDISPKEYIKVARFRKALHLLASKKYSQAATAYELGYSDQSHFIKEIKYFTGGTPRQMEQNTRIIDNKVWYGIH